MQVVEICFFSSCSRLMHRTTWLLSTNYVIRLFKILSYLFKIYNLSNLLLTFFALTHCSHISDTCPTGEAFNNRAPGMIIHVLDFCFVFNLTLPWFFRAINHRFLIPMLFLSPLFEALRSCSLFHTRRKEINVSTKSPTITTK